MEVMEVMSSDLNVASLANPVTWHAMEFLVSNSHIEASLSHYRVRSISCVFSFVPNFLFA